MKAPAVQATGVYFARYAGFKMDIPVKLDILFQNPPWRTVRSVLGIIIVAVGSHYVHVPTLIVDTIMVVLLALLVHAIERDFLWKEVIEIVKSAHEDVSRKNNTFLAKAAATGITGIYLNRKDAASDIKAAIEKAENRIWLLGVAFSKDIELSQFVEGFKSKLLNGKKPADELTAVARDQTKQSDSFDLRIMVADPLRSPGVFRSFIESSADQMHAILECQNPDGLGFEAFYNQTLYSDAMKVFFLLDRKENSCLRDSLRFYAHNPNCWLIVADKTVYFEPYTFGLPEGVKPGKCIGPYFPVFRFEGDRNTAILVDHFRKLWLTTDMDWFHFKARHFDKDHVVKDLFSRRGDDWFCRVWQTLRKWYTDHIDRRRYPRKPCLSDPVPRVNAKWEGNPTGSVAAIRDCCREGISLSFENGSMPLEGQRVSLTVAGPPSSKQEDFLLKYFTAKQTGFEVVPPSTNRDPTTVGLRKVS